MAEGTDLEIEKLKEQFSEIKQKISQCRKRGFDTKIAELKAMAIPSKIKMAEATKDSKDIQKINEMLNYAKVEIDDLEISDNSLNEIYALMEKMDGLLNSGRIKEARENYLKCNKIYGDMAQVNKKKAFERLNYLRTRLVRG